KARATLSLNLVSISSWRFSKWIKLSERTCDTSGSWFATKHNSRKFERNSPRNTNSNWSHRSAATFTIHGATEFRWLIFTMNHSSGSCLMGKCKRRASNLVVRDAALWRPDGAARRPYHRTDLEAYVPKLFNATMQLRLERSAMRSGGWMTPSRW